MKIIKNSDVMLINVPMERGLSKREEIALLSSMPPLGMLYIMSYLEKAGYAVSFVDLAVEMFDRKEFVEGLMEANPKLVGLSTYVESWDFQNSLADSIKSVLKESIIVAGGHCASFCYEDILKNRSFDYLIRGEGEEAFLLLTNYLINGEGKLNDIGNLVYIKDGHTVINPSKRILDIESLPYPARDAIDFLRYSYPFTISTSRGCPGRCIFCSSRAFWGKKVKIRSAGNIISEIKSVYNQYSLRDFFIIDDTFTFLPARTIEFCDRLNEFSEEINEKFSWGCESRADVVDYKLLRKMKDSGCQMIQFGMESGNNEILKSIKKNIKYEQVYESVKLAYELGIKVNVSFIIGHHEDTHETIQETLEKALDLKRSFNANVLYGINTPYPGTELRKKKDEFGLELMTDNYRHLLPQVASIATNYLSQNDIRKYYNIVAEALDNV